MSVHSKRSSQDFQIIQEIIKSSDSLRLYQKGSFLGRGGFARVYELTSIDTKKTYAGKIIEKISLTKNRIKQKLMTEIKIHRSLNHPNIVKFEHFFEDSENIYILLELCQNHSLSELIRRRKRLTEIEAQYYLTQIIDALMYLHGQKVIHRDIKLGNLLLNEKLQVKMADFGLACKLEFDGERKNTICGTPNYIAPEIICGGSGHSYEVDVWSFGVLAFTMLIGRPPFETSDVKETYRKIKSNAYSFPDHVELSAEAKELISRILVLDPKERPSFPQIRGFGFFNKNQIPESIPLSSLAIAPNGTYLKQFQRKEENLEKVVTKSVKAEVVHIDKENIEIRPAKQAEEKPERPHPSSKKSFISSLYVQSPNGPAVYIKKWIDFTSKYGVAYLLSNNSIGIYFNDTSKLISDFNGKIFKYLERGISDIMFTNEDVPSDIKKKVSILDHFRKYLNSESKETNENFSDVFIKKAIITQHAFIFRVSNQLVQIRFLDKSEVLINGEAKAIIYINKHQECKEFPISSIFDCSCPDITKRMKYIKEILTSNKAE